MGRHHILNELADIHSYPFKPTELSCSAIYNKMLAWVTLYENTSSLNKNIDTEKENQTVLLQYT